MSIAEQLITIADNEEKVYHAGELAILDESQYMHPTISGPTVSANDVSDLEHKLNVNLIGKNLLNIEPMLLATNWRADSSLNVSGYWNYPIIGLLPNTEYTLSMKENGWSGVSDNGLYVTLRNNIGVFAEAGGLCHNNGHGYYCKSKVTITSNENGMLYLAFYNPTDERLALFFSKCPEMMLELGSTATEYTPYISNFSNVTVSRLGKNLATPQEIYQGATSYGVVTFDGRTAVRFVDNLIISHCGNVFKPNTQYTVSFDCRVVKREEKDGNSGIFTFHYDDGKRNTISLPRNTEWEHVTLTSTAGKTVVGVGTAMYHYVNYNYIDVNSFQLEEGTVETEYEPYTKIDTLANPNGTITADFTKNPTTTTFVTNTDGVAIDCQYYRDIDKFIDNIAVNLSLTGGE